MLKNPNADEGAQHWRAGGKATVEEVEGGKRYFVLRNGGSFSQEVTLPKGAAGQYAVLIGRASSERIDPDGAITGLPYLYGFMVGGGSDGHLNAHLNGQHMGSAVRVANEWGWLWGIFRVPAGTGQIAFILKQGERRGVPHDGSAARFDDLGLYLFPTEDAARTFVGSMTNTVVDQPVDQVPVPAPPCFLTLAQAPEIHGLRLGMSVDEVLASFPGSADDPKVRSSLEEAKTNHGYMKLSLHPERKDSESKIAKIKRLLLQFLDNHLFSINVEYDSPKWTNIDEFISKYAGSLNLPEPTAWESSPIGLKYLVCDGFEVRFYAAPARSSNTNYISITNIQAGSKLRERKAADEKR